MTEGLTYNNAGSKKSCLLFKFYTRLFLKLLTCYRKTKTNYRVQSIQVYTLLTSSYEYFSRKIHSSTRINTYKFKVYILLFVICILDSERRIYCFYNDVFFFRSTDSRVKGMLQF